MVVVTHAEAGGGEQVDKTLGLQRRGFQRGFAAEELSRQHERQRATAPLREESVYVRVCVCFHMLWQKL